MDNFFFRDGTSGHGWLYILPSLVDNLRKLASPNIVNLDKPGIQVIQVGSTDAGKNDLSAGWMSLRLIKSLNWHAKGVKQSEREISCEAKRPVGHRPKGTLASNSDIF